MLHINDIQYRLKNTPEPKEVAEIREHILSSFSNLEFIEEGHKYYIHNEDGTIDTPISVSGLIKEFEQHVDWDVKAEGVALKEGVDVEIIKRRWKENTLKATNSGTQHHEFGESYMNFVRGLDSSTFCNSCIKQYEEGYLIPCAPKQEAIVKYWEDIFKIDKLYPLLPEVKMYMPKDNKFGIKKLYCGTADITFAMKYKGEWCILLHDYKGLPLNTPIATIDGWKNMSDIQKNDIVFDKNGLPTKVLNVSQIHNNPCLKIKFDNNTEITCDEEHRWEISFLRERFLNGIKERYFDTIVMTGKELFNFMHDENNFETNKKTGKKKLKPYLVPKILNSKAIELPKTNLLIHPYVLGVWLGDGNKIDGKITNMYQELWDEIEKCGYKIGKDVSQGSSGKAQTRTVFGLTHQLRLLGLLKNKHIPDSYLRSSYEQRLDILRGLMDTDGYYNACRNRYVISTTKKEQIDFSMKLLCSLGIKPTIIKAKGKCNNCKNKKIFDKWDISFATDIYPFKIRQLKINNKKNIRNTFRNIKSVEYCETVQTKCIEVDSPTHTYCCGYDMLVTHNTNKALISDYNQKFNICMLPPFDDMIDQPTGHYSFQLSAYQLMLMNLGYKVIDRKLIWLKDDGNYEKVALPDITDKIIKVYQ